MEKEKIKLQERLESINGEQQQIYESAAADKRDFNEDERRQLDSLQGEFVTLEKDLARICVLEEQSSRLNQSQGRKTEPTQPVQNLTATDNYEPPEVIHQGRAPANQGGYLVHGKVIPGKPRWPHFEGLGHFAQLAFQAGSRGGYVDERLTRCNQLAAATIYASEADGASGGFFVPPDLRAGIVEKVMGEDSLARLCDQIPLSGNTYYMNVDEGTPWGSTGIQAYWTGEGVAKTQSKPAIEQRTVKVDKLAAIVPVTDELLDDAPALDAYLRRITPERFAFALNLAIVQGNGVGKPLGILNSPATVSVAKESGQVADTLIANNVIKMYARMWAPLRGRENTVWLINQDIEPQLHKLSIPGTDNTGNAVSGWGGLVYMPANGLSGMPYGTLFGKPVIATQACETLGDKGDIIFAAMSQYLLVTKGGLNPKIDVSIHLWFDQDISAYRFVLRVGGHPWAASTVAARDGSTTYGAFVTLDERA